MMLFRKLKELREHFMITWISKYYNLNRDYEDLKKKYDNLHKNFLYLANMVDVEFWEEVDSNESICSTI